MSAPAGGWTTRADRVALAQRYAAHAPRVGDAVRTIDSDHCNGTVDEVDLDRCHWKDAGGAGFFCWCYDDHGLNRLYDWPTKGGAT